MMTAPAARSCERLGEPLVDIEKRAPWLATSPLTWPGNAHLWRKRSR
jgi:hypothetical protein